MMTLEQRIRSRMDVNPTTGCWEWRSAARDPTGNRYGAMTISGRTTPAHRVAYELWVGPIPDGLEIDHLCHVRACVNPDHLEAVTHAENMRRSKRAIARRRREWPSAESRQEAKRAYRVRAAVERQEERREAARSTARLIAAKYPHLADIASKYEK